MDEEQSLDDILTDAAKFMKQLGLDTDILEDIPTEEDLNKEAEEAAAQESIFFDETVENANPFEYVPVEARIISELSTVERMQIEERYGQQDSGKFSGHSGLINEVRTLSVEERCVFAEEDFLSPQFNLQLFYKINSDMDRRDVMANIREFFAENPLLRVNFFSMGVDAKTYKLVFKKKEPRISLFSVKYLKGESLEKTLAKIMLDERQRPFDLSGDTLIRFNLIKVGEDYYGLIVTMSRLIASAWDERRFFKKVFGYENAKIPEIDATEQPFSVYAANYYLKLLTDLPPIPNIPRFSPDPNRFIPRTHQIFLHPQFYKILKQKSLGKKDVMIAILATAWGLLQKQVNYNRDTYFALLLSEHSMVKNPQVTAGRVYPVPVRITVNGNATVDDVVGRLLRQMLTSKSLGCTKMKYILKEVGEPRDLFPCYLHFHGFSQTHDGFEDTIVKDTFALLDIEAFDAGKRDLNIYFDIKREGLSITFSYNPFSFENRTIKPLAKYFEIAIGCLLVSFGQDISVFEEIFSENIKGWDRSFGSYIL